MEINKIIKKYWWLGLLLIPVGMLLASIRIRKVRTINYTDWKGNKLSVKGTVKRNASNSGYNNSYCPRDPFIILKYFYP